MYFWSRWVFIAALGLSLVAARGAPLGCDARAFIVTASRVMELGSIGFSSCTSQARELGLRS